MAYNTREKQNANNRKRYKEDHARQRQAKNKYRKNNVEHIRKYHKEYMRKNRYGIEPTRSCPDNCECCGIEFGAPMSFAGPCFDHDHETNTFRGWLCRRCNIILGNVNDNQKHLIQLANYLHDAILRS